MVPIRKLNKEKGHGFICLQSFTEMSYIEKYRKTVPYNPKN